MVVVSDKEEDGHGNNKTLEEQGRHGVHANHEENGGEEQGRSIQGDGKGVLTDDHVDATGVHLLVH